MNGSALTLFAWIFMLASMLSVTALVAYCYRRILFDDKGEPEQGLRPPPDTPPQESSR